MATQTQTATQGALAAQFETTDVMDFENKHYGDWRDEFHRDGCVLIKNVVSPDRAQWYREKQIQWLKNFDLGFDEKDESTWKSEHLPINFKGGMYLGYGVCHERMAWEARLEPGVIDAFEKLWETKELITSFDGINISLPNRADLGWKPWPHCDQNPRRKGYVILILRRSLMDFMALTDENRMQAVQGLLNFAPNGPKDGGLMLMKGSTKLFEEFFSQQREQMQHDDHLSEEQFLDVFLFKDEDLKWFQDRGCELVKVDMEPGDLVLWDSRTMHYARLPEGDQIRHVQYICMTPRRFASEEALQAKKYCFEHYIGTTHWPHCNIRPIEEKPMRNGEICPKYRNEPFEKPVVTERILQLAGVKAY